MGISCSLRRADEERLLGGHIPFDLRRVCAETLWRPRDSGLEAAGGKTLIRGIRKLREGAGDYNSAAYQAALKVLGSAAERDFRIVEGVA